MDAAGLMGFNNSVPKQRGGIYVGTDANGILESGFYKLGWDTNTGCTNFPNNDYLYGSMLVFSSENTTIQILVTTGAGAYIRLRYGGWYDWVKIY